MNQDQALQYLYNLTSLGWKLGLNKIRSLLAELNNPHEQYPTIHVAGTNGKGSTSAMMESILRSAGYKTGLFTSPHLVYIGERIKCNGKSSIIYNRLSRDRRILISFVIGIISIFLAFISPILTPMTCFLITAMFLIPTKNIENFFKFR